MTGGDRGAGLLVVMLAMLLLSALGLAVVMAAIGDALASGNLRSSREIFYAADAGIERSLPDLQNAPDWNLVLSGASRSGFADGPPAGVRLLPDGRAIVLDELVNLANCGRREACDEASLAEVSEDRPWGADNPWWRLFAWGPFPALAGEGAQGYLAVMVGDDPLDGDGDPSRDASGASPGSGVLRLRAHAFGIGGASRVIEATVARTGRLPRPDGYTGQRGGAGQTTGTTAAGVQAGEGGVGRTQIVMSDGEAAR